jgi:hypothetical protein
LMWGVLILTNPSVSVLYAGWLLYNLWRVLRRTLAPLFLILAFLPVVVVTPWTLRNYLTFGRFVVVRDNFGLELQVSNNPCSSFSLSRNTSTGCFAEYHPTDGLAEAIRVRTLGEVAYNHEKLKEATTWIKAHPDRFLDFGVARFVHFWFPTDQADLRLMLKDDGGYRQYALIVWVMTLLSLLGLYLSRENRSVATILFLWLAVFPLIYYCLQYTHRYRVPILWVTFLLGGHAVARLCQKLIPPLIRRLSL